jgi:asparagine N-glycosylation enzyme membrane subunit Stt3
MLTTIATILIILWLIGFIGFPTLGGFIHLLLVVAIILFLIRIIQGENPLK